jgi:predicted amidophosphoribosyltransferase
MSDYRYLSAYHLYEYDKSERSDHTNNIKEKIGYVKKGRIHLVESDFGVLNSTELSFIDSSTILVPVPRSAPQFSATSTYPALSLCNKLISLGFGKEVLVCLKRDYAVNKSAFQDGADGRASVKEHYDSFSCTSSLDSGWTGKILLVDDVITQGRTSYAAYLRLQEEFLGAEINVFTYARANRFELPIDQSHELKRAEIRYNGNSGKTTVQREF